jgi:hypothetical protein
MLGRFMAHYGQPPPKGAWLWYYSNHCFKLMNINNIVTLEEILSFATKKSMIKCLE